MTLSLSPLTLAGANSPLPPPSGKKPAETADFGQRLTRASDARTPAPETASETGKLQPTAGMETDTSDALSLDARDAKQPEPLDPETADPVLLAGLPGVEPGKMAALEAAPRDSDTPRTASGIRLPAPTRGIDASMSADAADHSGTTARTLIDRAGNPDASLTRPVAEDMSGRATLPADMNTQAAEARNTPASSRLPQSIAATTDVDAEQPVTIDARSQPAAASNGRFDLGSALGTLQNLVFGDRTAFRAGSRGGEDMTPSPSLSSASPATAMPSQSASPAAAPVAQPMPTIAEPLGGAAWQSALSQQAVRIAGSQTREAVLALHPKDLGQVAISIHVDDAQQAQMHLSAGHAHVREAIENALPQLRQALAAGGITLGDTAVDSGDTHGQRGQPGEPGVAPGEDEDTARLAAEPIATPPTRAQQVMHALGHIDLFA